MTTIKKTTTKKRAVAKKKSSPAKSVAKKKVAKKKSVKQQALKLDPVLVINNAKALSKDLNKLLKNNEDINIDASKVEMVDTAILQLLLAITLELKSKQHQVHWIKPSPIFISNASLLGINNQLGLA